MVQIIPFLTSERIIKVQNNLPLWVTRLHHLYHYPIMTKTSSFLCSNCPALSSHPLLHTTHPPYRPPHSCLLPRPRLFSSPFRSPLPFYRYVQAMGALLCSLPIPSQGPRLDFDPNLAQVSRFCSRTRPKPLGLGHSKARNVFSTLEIGGNHMDVVGWVSWPLIWAVGC